MGSLGSGHGVGEGSTGEVRSCSTTVSAAGERLVVVVNLAKGTAHRDYSCRWIVNVPARLLQRREVEWPPRLHLCRTCFPPSTTPTHPAMAAPSAAEGSASTSSAARGRS